MLTTDIAPARAGNEDYSALNQQLRALLASQRNFITNASQMSAFLYQMLDDLNWAGFYLLHQGELILGPFQGKVACTPIAMGRGVCGTCAEEKKIQIVEDVLAHANHIACDAASRSELVLPILYGDGQELLGVLDLDSPSASRFTEQDADGVNLLLESFLELTDCSSLRV